MTPPLPKPSEQQPFSVSCRATCSCWRIIRGYRTYGSPSQRTNWGTLNFLYGHRNGLWVGQTQLLHLQVQGTIKTVVILTGPSKKLWTPCSLGPIQIGSPLSKVSISLVHKLLMLISAGPPGTGKTSGSFSPSKSTSFLRNVLVIAAYVNEAIGRSQGGKSCLHSSAFYIF
jgi:hypothetical protein